MKKSYPQVPNVFQSAPPPPKEGGLDQWVQARGVVDTCLRVRVGIKLAVVRGPVFDLLLFGFVKCFCLTDSAMVNHHFSPPFGRICLELFPRIEQANPRENPSTTPNVGM